MSIETIKKILDWSVINNNTIIRYLGGEPTLYSNFDKIFDITYEKYPDAKIVIITNLLGFDKNIDVIKYYIDKKNNPNFTGLLINSTSDEDKKEKFINNLNKLYIINPEVLCLGITLMPNKQINKKNLENLKFLLKKFNLIREVRFGFETPIPTEKFQFYNYTDDTIQAIEDLRIINSNIRINFDCRVSPCAIDLDLLYSFKNTINIVGSFCDGTPMDIYPDCSSKYCYSSLDNYKVNNIFDFENSLMLERYFKSLEFGHKIKNKICLNCKYYKCGKCIPCHAIDDAIYYTSNNI